MDDDEGATTRERVVYLAPRIAGFAVLVALPVTAALAWLSAAFGLGAPAQFGLLLLAVLVFRFALRPRLAPLFTHPKDRADDAGED